MNEELIYGKWLYEDDHETITLDIKRKWVEINIVEDGQETLNTRFPTEYKIIGNFCIFLDSYSYCEKEFYFSDLTEKIITFGELGLYQNNTNMLNEPKWSRQLERIV